MSYHYTESGLDNVFLGNGYKLHKTKYGEGLSIENVHGLHQTIGRWLIELPKRLNGAELRFLRTEMELSQHRLADLIGSEEQNVRRWEKDRTKAIPGTADRFVRVLYSQFIGHDDTIRQILERLAELDEIERAQAELCETDHGWTVRDAA